MVTVDIWADIACPWCYLGKHRWDSALAAFPHSDRIQVRWRAFELRPGNSPTPTRTLGEIMRSDWNLPPGRVSEIFARITAHGRAEGLVLRPGSVRPGNTFDAHRLIKLAAGWELADPMLESLFRAYHSELANIADRRVLTDLALGAGVDRTAVEALWRTDAHADAIGEDRVLAAEAGVTAVPSYRIGERGAISGALSAGELLSYLRQGWPP